MNVGMTGVRLEDARVAAGKECDADGDEDHADELGDRERPEESVVLGPDDLDEEALDSGEDEEEAEGATGAVLAAAVAEQDEKDEERRCHLIELRRMDSEQRIGRERRIDGHTERAQA